MNRHEREMKRELIFSIVCVICGIFFLAMLTISYMNLLVVSASTYEKQTRELIQCKSDYEYLESELQRDVRENWESIDAED